MQPLNSEHCRFCGSQLDHTFVDLGMSPLCESYVSPEALNKKENYYPLHPKVCHKCFLVQIPEFVSTEEIFTEYAYYSSFSDSWLKHCETYVDMIVERLNLGKQSHVVELASNDGYLLQYFLKHEIPILGVEPAKNIAETAIEKGIPTIVDFFGVKMAEQMRSDGKTADLIIGNNVLAQVPDLNDFVEGIHRLLNPNGVVTLEFPHLSRLVAENQYDTIYHEHYSYFSLFTVEKLFQAHQMRVFDVEQLASHGGSIRIYACQESNSAQPSSERLEKLRKEETKEGVDSLDYYADFANRVKESKRGLLEFLIQTKREGKQVVGYGAPGKGNTLLNYCGIATDFLDYTVDRNPYKQGKFLPGSRIPIFAPERIYETKPDYLLILPWNLKKEIINQMADISDWGGQFIIPIPGVEVLNTDKSEP